MPNYATFQAGAVADGVAMQARLVDLSTSSPFDFAEVNIVELGCGIKPGRCKVTLRNVSSMDEAGNIVHRYGGVASEIKLQYYSRIKVLVRGSTVFIGSLIKRDEIIEDQAITLEYWDDRHLLSKLPMRGALVYDRAEQTVKYLPRYHPRPNANGYRNCTKVTIPGFTSNGDLYVFTELAEQGTVGLSPYDQIGEETNTSPGTALFWSDTRWAAYLRAFAMMPSAVRAQGTGTDPGPFEDNFGTLDTNKLQWPEFQFTDTSELHRHKMADIDFTGQTVLRALCKTLEGTGEYELRVDFSGSISTLGVSAVTADTTVGISLDLATSGAADLSSIVKGGIHSSAEDYCGIAVVEGSPARIESQFGYVEVLDNVAQISSDGSSTLFPAWDKEDEYYFMQMIWNALSRDNHRLKYSDGTNIAPGAQELINMARIAYPKVFRAYQIRGANLLVQMIGVNGKFTQYDFISSFKALLPEQLQPYYEQDTSGKVARGRLRLPVRIRVTDKKASDSTGEYVDVSYNNGLRIDDDGLVYFDGMTDDVAGPYNVYTGNLRDGANKDPADTSQAVYPKLRRILVNAAVETDFRVFGKSSINKQQDPNRIMPTIDSTALPQTTNSTDKFVHYTLNPAFREEHQVNSHPINEGTILVAGDNNGSTGSNTNHVTNPATLNRILHSDDDELSRASWRKLKRAARIQKEFQYTLPGIRPEFFPGQLLQSIVLRPSGSEFPVNAPIMRIRLDFDHQETTLAGQDVITGAD